MAWIIMATEDTKRAFYAGVAFSEDRRDAVLFQNIDDAIQTYRMMWTTRKSDNLRNLHIMEVR